MQRMKIKDSLKLLLPELVDNALQYLNKVDVANYHNFAMRLLYKHGYSINSEFVNLSEFQIVNEGSRILDSYITSTDSYNMNEVEQAVKSSDKEKILSLLDEYWKILDEKLLPNHVITYNGILISALKLLRKKQIASFYREYYQMVIVDEFQDTNYLGYLLIKKLIGNNIVIFLGDDVQKIYGFLGAVNGIFDLVIESYPAVEFKFCNNYRFKSNEQMKTLDLFIRDNVENYAPSRLKASVFLKSLSNDLEEDAFVAEGIENIISNKDNKVAVLVRVGWQGTSIIEVLDKKQIKYFNALFRESDLEYLNFYKIALEELYNKTSGKAVQRDLQRCLIAIESRKNEIYQDENRKYIFDSMYKLLEILFTEIKKWDGTTKEKYEYIEFTLANYGLKHMMEFLEEQVVLTTIHSAKGLEWDYIIIPKMNGYAFPNSYVCNPCSEMHSCNRGWDYCKFSYQDSMERMFKEEMSILYVALTRAKKNVFMTVNTGRNQWGHVKRKSCLINLEGLSIIDYKWENVL